MSTLAYADEVVPVDEVDELAGLGSVDVADREVKMAEMLVESLTAEFDPDKYTDEYRVQVLDLIGRKAAGEEFELPAVADEKPKIVDLMAALEASVEAAKASRARHPTAREAPADSRCEEASQAPSQEAGDPQVGIARTAASTRPSATVISAVRAAVDVAPVGVVVPQPGRASGRWLAASIAPVAGDVGSPPRRRCRRVAAIEAPSSGVSSRHAIRRRARRVVAASSRCGGRGASAVPEVSEAGNEASQPLVPDEPRVRSFRDFHDAAPCREQRRQLLDVGAVSPPARRDLALQPVAGDEPVDETGRSGSTRDGRRRSGSPSETQRAGCRC